MPQIIHKERTAHLTGYTLFTRDVNQYKNMSISQLYQPPRTSFLQSTYRYLLLSCEYCHFFRKAFLKNTSGGCLSNSIAISQTCYFVLQIFSSRQVLDTSFDV